MNVRLTLAAGAVKFGNGNGGGNDGDAADVV